MIVLNQTNVVENLKYLGPGDYVVLIRNSKTDPRSVIFGPRSEFHLATYDKALMNRLELLFKEQLDD